MGRDYKSKPRLLLYLDNLELSDILNQFKNKAKLFVLKVAVYYDINCLLLNTMLHKKNIFFYKK
jgi:hypothetical protein